MRVSNLQSQLLQQPRTVVRAQCRQQRGCNPPVLTQSTVGTLSSKHHVRAGYARYRCIAKAPGCCCLQRRSHLQVALLPARRVQQRAYRRCGATLGTTCRVLCDTVTHRSRLLVANIGSKHAVALHNLVHAVQVAAAADKPVILVSEKLGSAGEVVLLLLAGSAAHICLMRSLQYFTVQVWTC